MNSLKNDILENNYAGYNFSDNLVKYLDTHNMSENILDTIIENINILREEKNINIKEHIKQFYNPEIGELMNAFFVVNKYNPTMYQNEIINMAISYFKNNDKGILVEPCGIGKTLIALWICQNLSFENILIGVPNLLLLEQWKEKIINIFPNVSILKIKSNISQKKIDRFIKTKSNKTKIIITTYHSSHKIEEYNFDIKILDECHHITTIDKEEADDKKSFVRILNVKSTFQLALTATIKEISDDAEKVVSNISKDYFGEIIDRRCLLWAINRDIICDYKIYAIISEANELETILKNLDIDDNDSGLFLGAYNALKHIFDKTSHHILIYANSTENANKIIEYINKLFRHKYFANDGHNLCYYAYHSKLNSDEKHEILNKFETSKMGIISCVYCLGEGWDFPPLDGVVFAENMCSNIRIVQSALRAGRKNKNEPNKISKIIIPTVYKNNDGDFDLDDYKKIIEIIKQMGMEDITIEQKIEVRYINLSKFIKKQKKERHSNDIPYISDLENKIKTICISRERIGITYSKAIKIIKNNAIANKEEYYKLCEKDNRLPIEPDLVYKGQFTNWIEYLNIDRKYYDIIKCQKKIKEYNLGYNLLDIDDTCGKLCEMDSNFPPYGMWCDYYDKNTLSEIICCNRKKKKAVMNF